MTPDPVLVPLDEWKTRRLFAIVSSPRRRDMIRASAIEPAQRAVQQMIQRKKLARQEKLLRAAEDLARYRPLTLEEASDKLKETR